MVGVDVDRVGYIETYKRDLHVHTLTQSIYNAPDCHSYIPTHKLIFPLLNV